MPWAERFGGAGAFLPVPVEVGAAATASTVDDPGSLLSADDARRLWRAVPRSQERLRLRRAFGAVTLP